MSKLENLIVGSKIISVDIVKSYDTCAYIDKIIVQLKDGSTATIESDEPSYHSMILKIKNDK